MIKLYTGARGAAWSFFFIAGLVLFLSILFWGFAKALELLLPLLIVVSYLLIIIFLLVILPATLIKKLRPSLMMYTLLMSQVLGVSTWMMSFCFVIKVFGFLGILFAFLFQFLAPLALLGALLKGNWQIAGHLAIWISFTYVMKYYSQWLISLSPRQQQNKGDIIDVDAIEVEDRIE